MTENELLEGSSVADIRGIAIRALAGGDDTAGCSCASSRGRGAACLAVRVHPSWGRMRTTRPCRASESARLAERAADLQFLAGARDIAVDF